MAPPDPPRRRPRSDAEAAAGPRVSRRHFLGLAGAAAAGAAGCAALPWREGGPAFEREADVVVVGTGAAGLTAAVFAADAGARVLVLEKGWVPGGTTAKSGGVYWVPGSHIERARSGGEPAESREETLRALARSSYPQLYRPEAPRFGVPEAEWALLEAFYDAAAPAVEELEKAGALRSMPADVMVGPLPDYYDTTRAGGEVLDRRLWPRKPDGSFGLGGEMVRQLREAVEARGVPVLTGHPAHRLVTNGRGEVVGVAVRREDGASLRVRARRAVVFASGGYTHDPELILHHQPGPMVGGCAVPTNTGDFVHMAAALGAKLGHMQSAWRAQVVLEQALRFSSTPDDVFMPPGDSMILVNRLGRRVVNEKTNYNERTRVHFAWDAYRKEWINRILVMVYDQRSAELFGGRFPLPAPGTSAPWVVSADDWSGLASAVDARLAELAPRTGDVRLAPGFEAALRETVARFDGHARAGRDPDFHRGEQLYDREWHLKIWSFPNRDSGHALPEANSTMHPFSPRGPYHAVLLAAGTLDTNGGPVVDARARVVDQEDRPVPGLYGAGNCVAAPVPYYYAGGGTLGPALAFGYLAGRNAAAEPEKELV